MDLNQAAAIVGRWPEAMPDTERLDALTEAASKLAKYSADPDGTPARDALVILNAAINPHARRIILASLSTPTDGEKR